MRPSILNPLFADITSLPGVGPKLAALIGRVAGPRLVDLLFQAPIGLIDRSFRPTVADAPTGRVVTLKVVVDRHDPAPRGRRAPYKIVCSDETGFVTLIFFHARADYLKKILPEGAVRLVSGKVEDFAGGRQIAHPDYIVDPDNAEALQLHEPVYPLTAGLSSNVMRKAVAEAVRKAPALDEWQNAEHLARTRWAPWREALRTLHGPVADSDLAPSSPARQRLAYDELLANQLALLLIRRAGRRARGRAVKGNGAIQAAITSALSFALTGAQRTALAEILDDMAGEERMVRLVQGDVGSGKTIVAFLAMAHAVEAGHQAALMAPTEILARQHIASLAPLAAGAGLQIDCLTGRDKGEARRSKLAALARGETHILVGTHAIFQDDVVYRDLALAVVDEQHRFGVHQRVALTQKGRRPDLLVMTATPIPRTLALTAYGDMDVSQITEKPPGRKPVDTRAAPIDRLDEIVAGVRRAVGKGEQVYWVCPLVEESDVIDLTAVEDRFDHLKSVFGSKAAMVHGRMTASEKDAVMDRFHRGDVAILIATTVIEVGVNAPNATIMIVEHAERFGLAQLHQLRGRVGRGDKQATCILLYKPPLGETAKARLEILRQSEDGFLIAEEDLRLRGAGDVLGAAQSGFPKFRIADISAHGDLLAVARDDAKLIVAQDPELAGARGGALRTLLYLFSRDDAVKLLSAG